MVKIKLSRDLRKNILRGHPWVYKQAIQEPRALERAQMAQILDKKGDGVAWGIYDPHSPLALRVVSVQKKPPGKSFFEQKMLKAYEMRHSVFDESTNAYRLFNGEGEGLPGLVCDIYDTVAVIQFDGQGPMEFWDQGWISQWLLENTHCLSVLFKPRGSDNKSQTKTWGSSRDFTKVRIQENGLAFQVDLMDGQKTGFFLDQRENRQYLKQFSKGKKVLNLFSYTGGFSIYAGAGGATEVTSVDISKPASDLCQVNWELNELRGSKHQAQSQDVFEYIDSTHSDWDMIMVDPPSMSHSEKQKDRAIKAYVDVFSKAAKKIKSGGSLFTSSCSSHISFEDFFEIGNESLSLVRRKAQVLKVAGQGFDHPYPHFCPELRYLKFIHYVLD